MFVIDVIPFSKLAPTQSLSYRSREDLPVGTLVEITLRRRKTLGMVHRCASVREEKSVLKRASFTLLHSVKADAGMLPKPLVEAAQDIARYHATTVGAVLSTLFSEYIRTESFPPVHLAKRTSPTYEKMYIEESLYERVEEYKKRITTHASKGEAVLIVVPTLAEVAFWKKHLASFSPVILSGALSGTKKAQALTAAQTSSGLIISTPSFAWTPIENLRHIAIERVGAGGYRLQKRPYLDMRKALEALARARALPISYGDYPLPLEYRNPKSKSFSQETLSSVSVYDARAEKPELAPQQQRQETKEIWKAVPEKLLVEIKKAIEVGGRVCVLAVRKGYAPVVVCRDCGESLRDERGATLSFSVQNKERVLRSNDGYTIRTANAVCSQCGSWNLLPLGVGVERVVEELALRFPSTPIVEFIPELITKKSLLQERLVGATQQGVLVVGTEAMIPHLLTLQEKPHTFFSLALVASADSLLALPFWRSRERLIRLVLLLSSSATRTIVATRRPMDASIKALTSGGETFIEEETATRKVVQYPPYGTLLVFSIRGIHRYIEEGDKLVRMLLGERKVFIPDDRILSPTLRIRTLVVKLSRDDWPDSGLSERIAGLPPYIRVLIDPESFF
jgi:primosomal protein N'